MMIALAVALLITSCNAANAAVLPSGTYRYTTYDEGNAVGHSSIVVTRANGLLQVDESTSLSDDPIESTRTLDASFSTLEYVVTQQQVRDSISIHAKAATHVSGTNSTTLPPATAGPSIVFDFLVGEYAALPAMIHAATGTAFNVYCVCFYGFEVKSATIVPATAIRPAGVRATDAKAAFDFDDGTITLWYDPVTFVLRELDNPKARFRIILNPQP
jgi:hypothetical protein